MHTVLSSASREVVIGSDQPFCIIGERINPTGRRIFQEQLRAGDLSAIEKDVAAQVTGGANVLDINMGVPLTDEADLLKRAIKLVQSLTDLPVCIDSSVVEAINEHKPEIVGFSAFLTTTMPMFKANMNALQKAGIRDKVAVMVGGAPVTQEYADAVGADAYSADASATVKKAKELVEQRRSAVPA